MSPRTPVQLQMSNDMMKTTTNSNFTPRQRRIINGIRRIRGGIWLLALLIFCVFFIAILFGGGNAAARESLIPIGLFLAGASGIVHALIWILIWVLKGFWKED